MHYIWANTLSSLLMIIWKLIIRWARLMLFLLDLSGSISSSSFIYSWPSVFSIKRFTWGFRWPPEIRLMRDAMDPSADIDFAPKPTISSQFKNFKLDSWKKWSKAVHSESDTRCCTRGFGGGPLGEYWLRYANRYCEDSHAFRESVIWVRWGELSLAW